jgi:homoserine kinase
MADMTVGGRATVSVSATSANLGPGFDSLALALALTDRVEAEIVDSGVSVEVVGEGADTVARDESNLVASSMLTMFASMGVVVPGLRLVCRNQIPHGRGLGSSAAAIVAGLELAAALIGGGGAKQTLQQATEIEGHPDNVAACLLGGLTIAWSRSGDPHAIRLEVHADVRPIVFVPPQPLSTEVARGLLPGTVPHRDAAVNSGRAALLVAALTTRPDLLLDATADRLHQEYRRPAMPESLELVDALRAAGVAAVVSGAGPTVLALSTTDRPVDADDWEPAGWQALRLAVGGGAVVQA